MDAIVTSLFINQPVINTNSNTNTFFIKSKPKTLITINNKKNPSSSSNTICFAAALTPPYPHRINHTHPNFKKNRTDRRIERILERRRPPPPSPPLKGTTEHIAALKDTQSLRNLLINLQRKESNPLQILYRDDDWTKPQFMLAIRYLKETLRFQEIIQVFDMWKKIDESRINAVNYKEIIRVLCEAGLMEEGVSLLREMGTYEVSPSVPIYNFIISGYARKGDTHNALKFVEELKKNNLKPTSESFNELIRFYGNSEMYDEMVTYLKKMESEGCLPDHKTYNLLIMGFARGGLLKRMERAFRTLLSKRLELNHPTVMAMLETYADLEVLDKMDEVFKRVSRSKIMLKDDTVRKLAEVYINNHMFSKLERLGSHVASTTGRTEIIWCLHLLSQAGQHSKTGMEHVIKDMEEANFCWTPTVLSIFALTYLQMEKIYDLGVLLSNLEKLNVCPDIVTIGVLFDAIPLGLDASKVLETWKRMGYLDRAVDLITDPLVLYTFKKGRFLRTCDDIYTSMKPEVRNISISYQSLIIMVLQNK